MFRTIFKLIIKMRFKDAWNFYMSIGGAEKLPADFKDEDFEIYYPEID